MLCHSVSAIEKEGEGDREEEPFPRAGWPPHIPRRPTEAQGTVRTLTSSCHQCAPPYRSTNIHNVERVVTALVLATADGPSQKCLGHLVALATLPRIRFNPDARLGRSHHKRREGGHVVARACSRLRYHNAGCMILPVCQSTWHEAGRRGTRGGHR